jgi:hypothetical protein
MTDATTQQTQPGPVIAPPLAEIISPSFASVLGKADALLLEIDKAPFSQFLFAGRAQIVGGLSFIEAHFHQWAQKAAAITKASDAAATITTAR